jgi:transcriptional regulator with PAS, ATPase and Fis domain
MGMNEQLRTQALRFLGQSFEQIYDHAIAVDKACRITWVSDAYARFLGIDEIPFGHPITELIPNSTLPSVIESGKPTFLEMLHIAGQWVVVSAFPLMRDDGEIVGGFGFVAVNQLNQVKALLNKYTAMQTRLEETQEALRKSRRARYKLSQCVGESERIIAVKNQVRQAAKFDMAVLIQGETGTGKELFAQALHDLSHRSQGPFVSINVAAIPETLMEAEFFGVAPGAYTGADKKGREGKFKLADGGTLFLDEIGDMPPQIQAKLLRVLQEREFERLGSNQLESADVRIVAATSRNLQQRVEEGNFRADLFYRLCTFPIHLPPLRERRSDLPQLAEKLLEDISVSHSIRQRELTTESQQLLMSYDWPGNVRELRNVLEHACVISQGPELTDAVFRELLPALRRVTDSVPARTITALSQDDAIPLKRILEETERAAILQALQATKGRKIDAARRLDISRANLYERLKRLGLEGVKRSQAFLAS